MTTTMANPQPCVCGHGPSRHYHADGGNACRVCDCTRMATPLRTPEGVLAWRKAHRLSQRALGDLLDVQWITVLRWERGQVAIPRTVELALLYLDTTLEPTS